MDENEMNIKEKIGERILEARKAKGLTRKALAELTDDLKPSRINNWESGIRTPGPEEIKQLADALDLQPAYLMCLTDERLSKDSKATTLLVPLLDFQQACDALNMLQCIRDKTDANDISMIAVSTMLTTTLSEDAFALRVLDDSMSPEIRVNDVLIVDPAIFPKPGDFVAVQIKGKSDAIVCQYKKISYTSHEFELLTLNDKWPNITVNESLQVEMIGKVIQNIRQYA